MNYIYAIRSYDTYTKQIPVVPKMNLQDLQQKISELYKISLENVMLFYRQTNESWNFIASQSDFEEYLEIQKVAQNTLLGVNEKEGWNYEFSKILNRLPADGYRLYKNLFDLLQEPILYEPIYRAAAQCVEWNLQTSENLQPSNQQEIAWLTRMKQFLHLELSHIKIPYNWFLADIRQTLVFLGVSLEALPESLPCSPKAQKYWTSLTPTYELINKISGKKTIRLHAIPHENRNLFSLRRTHMLGIQKSLKSIFQEIEKILLHCNEAPCSQALLRHLLLKTGQIVEGSLKLNILSNAIACKKNPKQHIYFAPTATGTLSNDHHLLTHYQIICDGIKLSDFEIAHLKTWNEYASWMHLENNRDMIPLFFLKKALNYYENKQFDELIDLQKQYFIPLVEKMIGIAHTLLTALPRKSSG